MSPILSYLLSSLLSSLSSLLPQAGWRLILFPLLFIFLSSLPPGARPGAARPAGAVGRPSALASGLTSITGSAHSGGAGLQHVVRRLGSRAHRAACSSGGDPLHAPQLAANSCMRTWPGWREGRLSPPCARTGPAAADLGGEKLQVSSWLLMIRL